MDQPNYNLTKMTEVILESADGASIWVAVGPIGALTSEARWQIAKYEISGTDPVITHKKYANGGAVNLIADNYASYTYA